MDTDFVKKMKVFSDLLLTWIKYGSQSTQEPRQIGKIGRFSHP